MTGVVDCDPPCRQAGMYDGAGKWALGLEKRPSAFSRGAYTDRATKSEVINTGQWCNLEVVIDGDSVTLGVDEAGKLSHTFASGVEGGEVGLLVNNARGPVRRRSDPF